MCGIAGFFSPPRSRRAEEMNAVVTAMTDAIILRGPDDAGAWVQPEHGIALGHRRLSILDLSPLGHQPMTSADGRYVIALGHRRLSILDLSPLGHQPMTTADGRHVIAPLSTPDQSIPKPPSHATSSKGAADFSPGLAEPQRGNPGSGSPSQQSKPSACAAHRVHQQRLPAPPPHAAPAELFRPAPTNSALARVPFTHGACSGTPATPITTP